MGQFKDIGLSKDQTRKLAHTRFNVVDDHTTLWIDNPRDQESEAESAEDATSNDSSETQGTGGDKFSYYDGNIIGPAESSEYCENKFTLAVAFGVPANVEGLQDCFTVNNLDLNPPQFLLTDCEHDEFRKKLAARIKNLADAEKADTDKEPQPKPSTVPNLAQVLAPTPAPTSVEQHNPSNHELIAAAHLIMSAEPDYYKSLANRKVMAMREIMREEFHLNISFEKFKKTLACPQQFCSYGCIPVDAIDDAALQASEARQKEAQTLPVRGKMKKEPNSAEQIKQENMNTKFTHKRLREPGSHLLNIIKPLKFEQKEETTAKITFREDPHDRSLMRLHLSHLYKDELRPEEQPSIETDIDLTYRNTRSRDKLPTEDGDTYTPTHRIFDVSEQSNLPTLEKLFPHLVKRDPKYWDKLYLSLKKGGQSLMLVCFQQNNVTLTSNLFTPREEVPTSIQDLRIIMRNTPTIYTLIRGTHINKIVNSVIHRFCQLAEYDPLLELFIDRHNPYINNKGIKETLDLPKFSTLPENTFETFWEFSIHCGVGTVIEQRFAMQKDQEHCGLASIHPVPHTQSNRKGVRLDLALCLNLTEDRSEKIIPRLAPGDHVDVEFDRENANVGTEAAQVWRGRVVAPTISTGLGQVCIVADRPWDNKAKTFTDLRPITTLTVETINDMTPAAVRAWCHNNKDARVVVTKKADEKECKRLCNGLSNMTLPYKLRQEFPKKGEILEGRRELMLCKDHLSYHKSSLYDTIHPEDRQKFQAILPQKLHAYQQLPVNYWLNEGVTIDIAALGGISGSGKTHMSITILIGYLLQNRISYDKRTEQVNDLARTLNSIMGCKKSKATENTSEAYCGQEEYEPGRVTHVCVQNETVNHSYETWTKLLPAMCKAMKVKPKFVIRLHSMDSERRALEAMLNSNFPTNQGEYPNIYRQNPALSSQTNECLKEHYLGEFVTKYTGIADKRFHCLRGSAAYAILQLAEFPGFPMTRDVANTWSSQERHDLKESLEPLLDAMQDIDTNERMTETTASGVRRAFKIGYYAIIERAAVICCTLATATDTTFQMHRKAHAVGLEEAGRTTDLDLTALLSTHWACDFTLLVGDWRQLGPTPYGPKLENPFQKQLSISSFQRLYYTGFPIQQLLHTSRFTNEELLNLCGHLNKVEVAQVPGIFDAAKKDSAERTNMAIWKVSSPIVVINTTTARPNQDITQSWYCIETAITTMHDLTRRLTHIPGKHVMVITPYNAQLRLLNAMRDKAVRKASYEPDLAKQLLDVMIITVDSSMGKERHHVILDTVGNPDGFLWRESRSLVAGTRARTSFVFIGPASCLSKAQSKNRLIEQLFIWAKQKLIVTLECKDLDKYEQYIEAQSVL
jgi:hypothetical protein